MDILQFNCQRLTINPGAVACSNVKNLFQQDAKLAERRKPIFFYFIFFTFLTNFFFKVFKTRKTRFSEMQKSLKEESFHVLAKFKKMFKQEHFCKVQNSLKQENFHSLEK